MTINERPVRFLCAEETAPLQGLLSKREQRCQEGTTRIAALCLMGLAAIGAVVYAQVSPFVLSFVVAAVVSLFVLGVAVFYGASRLKILEEAVLPFQISKKGERSSSKWKEELSLAIFKGYISSSHVKRFSDGGISFRDTVGNILSFYSPASLLERLISSSLDFSSLVSFLARKWLEMDKQELHSWAFHDVGGGERLLEKICLLKKVTPDLLQIALCYNPFREESLFLRYADRGSLILCKKGFRWVDQELSFQEAWAQFCLICKGSREYIFQKNDPLSYCWNPEFLEKFLIRYLRRILKKYQSEYEDLEPSKKMPVFLSTSLLRYTLIKSSGLQKPKGHFRKLREQRSGCQREIFYKQLLKEKNLIAREGVDTILATYNQGRVLVRLVCDFIGHQLPERKGIYSSCKSYASECLKLLEAFRELIVWYIFAEKELKVPLEDLKSLKRLWEAPFVNLELVEQVFSEMTIQDFFTLAQIAYLCVYKNESSFLLLQDSSTDESLENLFLQKIMTGGVNGVRRPEMVLSHLQSVQCVQGLSLVARIMRRSMNADQMFREDNLAEDTILSLAQGLALFGASPEVIDLLVRFSSMPKSLWRTVFKKNLEIFSLDMQEYIIKNFC